MQVAQMLKTIWNSIHLQTDQIKEKRITNIFEKQEVSTRKEALKCEQL